MGSYPRMCLLAMPAERAEACPSCNLSIASVQILVSTIILQSKGTRAQRNGWFWDSRTGAWNIHDEPGAVVKPESKKVLKTKTKAQPEKPNP